MHEALARGAEEADRVGGRAVDAEQRDLRSDAVRRAEERAVAAHRDDQNRTGRRRGNRCGWSLHATSAPRSARAWRTSSIVSVWSMCPGRMRRTVSSPASSRRAMRASSSSSTHLRHDERLSTTRTRGARGPRVLTVAPERRRLRRARRRAGAGRARSWRRGSLPRRQCSSASESGMARDRGVALERGAVFGRRGARARVDLDAEVKVALGDHPRHREHPVAERFHGARLRAEA